LDETPPPHQQQTKNETRFQANWTESGDRGQGHGEESAHHALVDDLSALGDGLAGVVCDGVGVAQDRAGHAAAAAGLDGLAHRAPQPRRHRGITAWRRRRRE